MQHIDSVVAVYGTHPRAEAALRTLHLAGFDMTKLSIIGRDYHSDEQVAGLYSAGDQMRFWSQRGAFWGGFWRLLFGSALFVVPGLGAVMVLGPLAGWIVGALSEAALAGGLSTIGAGLHGIGIPRDSALEYEAALGADHLVVVAHGTVDDVAAAKRILEQTAPLSLDEHRAIAAVAADRPRDEHVAHR